MLRKKPGFTAIALITLAIGIGANTIMFSVVNVLLFHPLHVQEPDRLVGFNVDVLRRLPYEAYVDMRDNNPVFSDLVAHDWGPETATLVWGDITKRAHVMYVSSNYFSTLGVAPARGRIFLPEEERVGAGLVTVLSHRLWQRQGADPEIIGQRVSVNGTLFQVVGVTPESFTGAALIGPDLWLPLGSEGLVQHRSPGYPLLKLAGRLRPGLSVSAAQAQLQSLIPRLRKNFPKACKNHGALSLYPLPRVFPAGTEGERAYMSGASLFLMGVSAAVLLIACLNLANMLIVQGTARHREIAIRMAIGGGRWRIIRQLLIESLLLAVLGGVLGLILALWGTRILNAWVAVGQIHLELASSLKTGLDLRVLVVTLGFCMIATVLFGLKPALRLSRRDVIADLKEPGCGVIRSARRTRRMLPRGLSVVCQIALSVVLVMGAALFTHNALNLAWLDHGFSLDGKLLIKVDPSAAGYDQARSVQVYEELTEHLRSMPGIQAVGVSGGRAVDTSRGDRLLREYLPGSEEERFGKRLAKVFNNKTVGMDYFEALDIPLLQGRSFHRLDTVPNAERVAIIDESLALKLRPNGNALGCLIQFGWRSVSPPHRVIGIIPNLRIVSDNKEDSPHIFRPCAADGVPGAIHIRVGQSESETAMVQRIPEVIRKVNPRLPVISVMTLTDSHRNNIFVWLAGLGARLSFAFGAMALFLASLGIYAVKGYMVASRTPEIGIRKALGATHRDIMGMVFREGLVVTIIGLMVGLLLGLGAARVVTGMLYGVNTIDPVSIAVTIALLGIASLLAGYFPARRAAKVDPMEALRYE